MPRPFRSGAVLRPAVAALAVAAVLGGLVVVLTGTAAVTARAEIRECDDEVAAAARSDASGAVAGGLIGAEVGTCSAEQEEPEELEEPVTDARQDPPDGAIGADGRTFTREGRPFFWLGDTAWSLFVNLTRTETQEYLDARADQGFTVIQAVAVFPQAGGPGPNQYGDSPYGSGLDDLAVTEGGSYSDDEQYDYWDHVDFVVEQAAERGLVTAILPVWADTQVGELVTEDNAEAYGRFLGRRYGDRPNVVWVMGGDAPADGAEDVWSALAGGIRAGGGHQLMTYHPRGDQSSVTWFDGADWIGFHMLQGGHCLRYDVRAELVAQTYEAGLPFVDGEPIYEDHPYCWRPEDGFSTPLDVRRDAYWSVLGGAAGHTYGHHAVWQFLADGRRPELGARGSWTEALTAPGAQQMQNVRALVESRPRVEPSADVVTEAGSGAERIQAAVAADGSTLMAYTPAGRDVTVDLGALDGRSAQPWWFDPRTGDATRLDPVDGGDTATFSPPGKEGDGADWVLVVDDAAAGFGAPGAGRNDRPATDDDSDSPDSPDSPDGPDDPDGSDDPEGREPETGASGQDLDDPDAEVAPGSAGDDPDGAGDDRDDGTEGRAEDDADEPDDDREGDDHADDPGDDQGDDQGDGRDEEGEPEPGPGDSGEGHDGEGEPGEDRPEPAPEPERAPEPPRAAPAPQAQAEAVWDRLAQCESSGDWGIDTGNGYHGGLQFDSATWRDYGGTEFAPDAHLATREQQITVAERVRDDRGGYGSWPACATRLGLPRWSRWSW